MVSPKLRRTHEKWLIDLTGIPTAAGREQRIIDWIERWVRKRPTLCMQRDAIGNILIMHNDAPDSKRHPPLYITAHLDHPAFVVREVIDSRTIELEFRGGVHDPYFVKAKIEIIDGDDRAHPAAIESLDAKAQPFKRVTVRLKAATDSIVPGDVGRWMFSGLKGKLLPFVEDGLLHSHACDDLAAVAAALAVMDVVRKRERLRHVGLLFTVAEEVGFIGAIGACREQSIPKNARLICLENSRSYAESPIGGGPILRVGDRTSVFDPRLTNAIGAILTEHEKAHIDFKWQRKLMPGGTCEATVFSEYGYESTCVCLPLGNYHNMRDIDGVLAGGRGAGGRTAKVAPENIALDDYHGMIEMLLLCAEQLDADDHGRSSSIRDRLEGLYERYSHVLKRRRAGIFHQNH